MSDYNYHDYNCPDCNEAKLQSDKNARKINEVIEQVNALIEVNNETDDFIEEKVTEKVEEIAEISPICSTMVASAMGMMVIMEVITRDISAFPKRENTVFSK